ncbi:hypothetical protein BC739_009423 [Kutzneria viridogrisea]|uniref:Uncharacterized protein n=1 Tax=Kutzneria viridogrisea TaxID=47990 RepID=A0ABR6BZ26_9PSEU|nr:hypothetical protein [Kutzneria viridogrisea]
MEKAALCRGERLRWPGAPAVVGASTGRSEPGGVRRRPQPPLKAVPAVFSARSMARAGAPAGAWRPRRAASRAMPMPQLPSASGIAVFPEAPPASCGGPAARGRRRLGAPFNATQLLPRVTKCESFGDSALMFRGFQGRFHRVWRKPPDLRKRLAHVYARATRRLGGRTRAIETQTQAHVSPTANRHSGRTLERLGNPPIECRKRAFSTPIVDHRHQVDPQIPRPSSRALQYPKDDLRTRNITTPRTAVSGALRRSRGAFHEGA